MTNSKHYVKYLEDRNKALEAALRASRGRRDQPDPKGDKR